MLIIDYYLGIYNLKRLNGFKRAALYFFVFCNDLTFWNFWQNGTQQT